MDTPKVKPGEAHAFTPSDTDPLHCYLHHITQDVLDDNRAAFYASIWAGEHCECRYPHQYHETPHTRVVCGYWTQAHKVIAFFIKKNREICTQSASTPDKLG